MKVNSFIIGVSLLFTSCSFQYLSMNTDENKSRAIKLADEYLKNKSEYSSLTLNEITTAKVVIGKQNDTIREVYKLQFTDEIKNRSFVLNIKISNSKKEYRIKG